jgi:hypothetical protein
MSTSTIEHESLPKDRQRQELCAEQEGEEWAGDWGEAMMRTERGGGGGGEERRRGDREEERQQRRKRAEAAKQQQQQQQQQQPRGMHSAGKNSMGGVGMGDAEMDLDLSPHMNMALRQEVAHYS